MDQMGQFTLGGVWPGPMSTALASTMPAIFSTMAAEERKSTGCYDAFEEAGPEGDDPLGAVLAPEDDLVALADSGVAQVFGEAHGARAASGYVMWPTAFRSPS